MTIRIDEINGDMRESDREGLVSTILSIIIISLDLFLFTYKIKRILTL